MVAPFQTAFTIFGFLTLHNQLTSNCASERPVASQISRILPKINV
jgi:hypothetical protein